MLLDALGHFPPEWIPTLWQQAFEPAASCVLPRAQHTAALAAAAQYTRHGVALQILAHVTEDTAVLGGAVEGWLRQQRRLEVTAEAMGQGKVGSVIGLRKRNLSESLG